MTNALWAYLDSRGYIPDRSHCERKVAVTLPAVQHLSLRVYSGWKPSLLEVGKIWTLLEYKLTMSLGPLLKNHLAPSITGMYNVPM